MENQPRDSILPEWKIKAVQLANSDPSGRAEYYKQFWAQTGQKMLRDPSGANSLLVRKTDILLNAGEQSKLSLSAQNGLFSAPWIGVKAKVLKIQTDPHGLSWNGKVLNPKLYQMNDKDFLLEASVRVWVPPTDKREGYWRRVSTPLRAFLEPEEDATYQELLKELGIP